MNVLKVVLIGFVVLFTPPVMADDAQDKDKQAIIDTVVAMWAAVEARDIDTYASYLHPDVSSFGEFDTYISEGKDKEVASYKDYFTRAHDVHTDMHQPKITISGDMAMLTYYWTDYGYAGDKRFTSRGKSTRVFLRVDGKWLSYHGHYTAVK